MSEKTVAGITKQEYEKYERVRASGVTNMYDSKFVKKLSGLSEEKQIAIMENFGELMKTWPDVREI